MHGITITKGPADWEIIQQQNGSANITLEGSYYVHPAAIEVGVESVRPIVRLMQEDDNTCVIPWTEMNHTNAMDFSGTFCHTFSLPEGGLYRIETSLETKSTVPGLTWLYRGDCILHIGVGNLFLIAGQSNAAGYSKDYAMDPPDLNVHLFRNRGKWDLACHPMNESTLAGDIPNTEMGIPGVSPYLSFGKVFQHFSHSPVGLIQTALGGSPLSRWTPPSGDLYLNLLSRISLTGGQYAGVLWYQGCSDTTPEDADMYGERFASMVNSLRKHLGYEIPFFTFQLNRQIGAEHDECWGKVREAQRRAALELPSVYILPTTNCSLSDGIHNSAHANVMLGEKLARQCAHVLCGAPEFEAPRLEAIHMSDKHTIHLTFSHMVLGFTLYSTDAKDNGFYLEDAEGIVPVDELSCSRQDGNTIHIKYSRDIQHPAYLSFCWEADPTMTPPVDEVTYLPPLSFYRVSVPEFQPDETR